MADTEAGLVLGAAVTGDRVPGQKAVRQAVLAAMTSGLLLPGDGALADAAFAGTESIAFPESLGLDPLARMPKGHCGGGGRLARRRPARDQFPGPGARANGPACDVPPGARLENQFGRMRIERHGERQAT